MDPFIGEIILFGGTFAPRGWAFCNGQTIQVEQNPALFSIVGAVYGGNGRTDFGVPDLQNRVPIHFGDSQGPGLSRYFLGQKGGTNTHTLTVNEMPSHTHIVNAHGGGKGAATTDNPSGAIPGDANSNIYSTESADITMSATMLQNAGGGQPISTMQAYLGVNYIIALEGQFPNRG